MYSASPVASVKVRSSKISAPGGSPYSCTTMSWMRCGDGELLLRRLRHPGLVDRQRDDRGAGFLHERHHRLDLRAPVLQVDRVDDGPAGVDLQRRFDHLRFGRVDHERRFDRLREPLDDRRHLHVFVGALGQRGADVEQVRAAFDLAARDQRDLVVVVGEQQALDLARALAVDALADQQHGAFLLRARRRSSPTRRTAAASARDARRVAASPRARRGRRGTRRCARASCRSSRRSRSRRSRARRRRARASISSGVSG